MKLGLTFVLLSLLAGEKPSPVPSNPLPPYAVSSALWIPQHPPLGALPSLLVLTPVPSPAPQAIVEPTPAPWEPGNASGTLSRGRRASSTSPGSSAEPRSSVTDGSSQLLTAASRECPGLGNRRERAEVGGWGLRVGGRRGLTPDRGS